MSPTQLAFVVAVVLIIAVVGLFYYGQQVKRRIETQHTLKVSPPVVVAVSAETAERLAGLSRQPIFVKQSTDGVRIQLDERPLVPLSMLTDQEAVRALREVVVAAGQRFGVAWTAVVSLRDDASVSIQRLA